MLTVNKGKQESAWSSRQDERLDVDRFRLHGFVSCMD